MGTLKVLPSQIANMIAAGEVVQRPSSVVKELMENAADAGADEVNVIVSDAGRTLIQVIDNGCGMSPSDAVLCFERHATSKIASAEDLCAIRTYGFRGEALASIAAVAEVTLRTRRACDDTATQVCISGSNEVRTSSVSAPAGSNFAVRNLFYNTPARRKFLKSDSVELRHIVEEFTRVAITRPEVAFSLSSNGRDIFKFKKAKSLKFRIMDLLGNGVATDLLDLDAETSIVKVGGFVGRPDTAKKTPGNQYFFVNGRYFRSAYLHKAVMKAYEEMIPNGTTPAYFIFLQVAPESIDVNIHPTKTEIKFEDESLIFQVVYACIKETLGRSSYGAGIDFSTEGAMEIPQLGSGFEQYKGISRPASVIDSGFDPFKIEPDGSFDPSGNSGLDFGTAGSGNQGGQPGFRHDNGGAPYFQRKSTDGYERLFDGSPTVQDLGVLVIQGKYIVTPAASGLMIVNIHRALERILYERALKVLSGDDSHVTQTALFPVEVQVGVQQRLLFDDNAETLTKLGFDIVPFGNDSVVVNGVPDGYSCETGKVHQLVSDLVYILSEDGGSLPEVMRQRTAEKFATLGASNAAPVSSGAAAKQMLDTLFACNNAELTSNGRRIVEIVKVEDIDKKF